MTVNIYLILLVVLMVTLNFTKITDGDFFQVFPLHGELVKKPSSKTN